MNLLTCGSVVRYAETLKQDSRAVTTQISFFSPDFLWAGRHASTVSKYAVNKPADTRFALTALTHPVGLCFPILVARGVVVGA